MNSINQIMKTAHDKKQNALSEYDSKLVIKAAGVPVVEEYLATNVEEAIKYAEKIGYPVVLKGCSDKMIHKTESGVVKLNVIDSKEVKQAFNEIVDKGLELDGILVQKMLSGKREFLIGLMQDAQFGPCVMFGLGGIFTEVLEDVSIRVAPLERNDAVEMIDELKTASLLKEFRGMPAVDKEVVISAIIAISELAMNGEDIAEIDINPLIITDDGKPVAVDSLIILK